jgi:hypothetical protein
LHHTKRISRISVRKTVQQPRSLIERANHDELQPNQGNV